VSQQPSLQTQTTTTTSPSSRNANEVTGVIGTLPVIPVAPVTTDVAVATSSTCATCAQKRYSATTAALIIGALHDLERIDDVVTISAVARRTGVSRPTVRAVLQQECGWTATHSRRAHHAGIHRGKLVQAVAGHPELAYGRVTLQIQGWPNLQRAHHAARASTYPALQRGRETQAAHDWPSLKTVHATLASTGYPHLAQGRANLAARGWPNWQRAQDVLKAQNYLPLLDGQLLRRHRDIEDNENAAPQTPQTPPETDRRRLRGRATRVAILEALRACQAGQAEQDEQGEQAGEDQCAFPSPRAGTRNSAAGGARRVTGRALAAQLQLHPATVYAHLKQIRQVIARETQEMEA
jgi:hypothetical protein